METIGFIFAMTGLSFALIANNQVEHLKKELAQTKKSLRTSGMLQDIPPDQGKK